MTDSPEDVLGVEPGTSPQALRAAYLKQVRRHHPDAHADESPEAQEAHAAQLRAATQAWDALHRPASPVTAPRAPVDVEPDTYEPDAVDDVDLHDDQAITPAAAGPSLTLIPVFTLLVSVVAFCLSVVLNAPAVWGASVVLFVLSLALFAVAPFFVMMRARR